MQMQLRLQVSALRSVEDTTEGGTDRFSLGLDFGGLNLELQLHKAYGTLVDAQGNETPWCKGAERGEITAKAPEAWRRLSEALAQLAALGAEHRGGERG